jgi:hypothetical protein
MLSYSSAYPTRKTSRSFGVMTTPIRGEKLNIFVMHETLQHAFVAVVEAARRNVRGHHAMHTGIEGSAVKSASASKVVLQKDVWLPTNTRY